MKQVMKKLTWLGMGFWMAVLFAVSSVMAAGLTTIDGKELEALMTSDHRLVIVDVREPELFFAGHIRGAINIPYDEAKPRIVKELSHQDRIVFVCHGGPMGDELGNLLTEKGYPTVYNLKGGMKKWKGEVVVK
jgi:rhodanese-related sulfurtransferase